MQFIMRNLAHTAKTKATLMLMMARGETSGFGEPLIELDTIERTICALMMMPTYDREAVSEQLELPVCYVLDVEQRIMLYLDVMYDRASNKLYPLASIYADPKNAFFMPIT